MSAAHKGLGKGLGALLQNYDTFSDEIKASVVALKINDIAPNADQPRKSFDADKLEELASSIRENGIIQPIIVCRSDRGYRIVAGERRWRAARMAGMSVVPAIVRELTEIQVLQHALIENIQRQDLNPLEEAYALEKLIKEHAMTQDKLASVVGRSRPAIANTLRLLNLPEKIKKMLMNEDLSAGHARAILAIEGQKNQEKAARLIVNRGFSVREAEKLVKKYNSPVKIEDTTAVDEAYALSVRAVEKRLANCLGTKVHLRDKKGKGLIQIEYYSNEELDRLLELIEKRTDNKFG